jgi:hypothetical protein
MPSSLTKHRRKLYWLLAFLAGLVGVCYFDFFLSLLGFDLEVLTNTEAAKLRLEAFKTVLLVGVAGIGIYQWSKEQRWKRRTMVLDRVKAFGDTPGTYNAQLMLSGRRINVPLWDRDVSANPYVVINPEDVIIALAIEPLSDPMWYDDKADAIRNSFNDFLSRLADLELDVSQARLLKDADVGRLTRKLYRDVVTLNTRAPLTARALWHYMHGKGYKDVADFLERGRAGGQPEFRDLLGEPTASMLIPRDTLTGGSLPATQVSQAQDPTSDVE